MTGPLLSKPEEDHQYRCHQEHHDSSPGPGPGQVSRLLVPPLSRVGGVHGTGDVTGFVDVTGAVGRAARYRRDWRSLSGVQLWRTSCKGGGEKMKLT